MGMSDAQLRVTREHLGLTGDWLAAHLGVQGRTVRRWEAGTAPIPDGVAAAVEDLEVATDIVVANVVAALAGHPQPFLATWRTDEAYLAAHPAVTWPASWHRAMVARVAEQVPHLTITYPPGEKP